MTLEVLGCESKAAFIYELSLHTFDKEKVNWIEALVLKTGRHTRWGGVPSQGRTMEIGSGEKKQNLKFKTGI